MKMNLTYYKCRYESGGKEEEDNEKHEESEDVF